MLQVATAMQTIAFESALGWMALRLDDQRLAALSFGYGDPQEAIRRLDPDGELGVESAEIDEAHPLARQLRAFAEGRVEEFRDVPLVDNGSTRFAREVLAACRAIPYGQTQSYGQLAAAAGSPRAARAVGNLMSANTTPLVVPCHRVVASGGRIGHYSAGEGKRTKLRLLEMEALATGTRRSSPIPDAQIARARAWPGERG
jgi:methylated-DNA-[protein]-cysteine S-methyltransferase